MDRRYINLLIGMKKSTGVADDGMKQISHIR